MQNSKCKIGVCVLILLTIAPLSVQAISVDEFLKGLEDWFSNGTSTQVINEVKVSANTGGNVVTDGEVKEGKTKSQVYIKNIINGKEITPVDIETEANEVSATSEIKADGGIAQVHREVTIDSEKKVEDYEVNLEGTTTDIENEEETKGDLEILKEWWVELVEDLHSFFQKIFDIF